MKRLWTAEELAEHWTLLPHELALVANKTGPTRLGFAVLLKFFGYAGRFPADQHEVPAALVGHLARQVEVPTAAWLAYAWRGRTIEYHRAQIRAALGFRAATVQDARELMAWLRDTCVVRKPHLAPFRPRSVTCAPVPHNLEGQRPFATGYDCHRGGRLGCR